MSGFRKRRRTVLQVLSLGDELLVNQLRERRLRPKNPAVLTTTPMRRGIRSQTSSTCE